MNQSSNRHRKHAKSSDGRATDVRKGASSEQVAACTGMNYQQSVVGVRTQY